MNAAPVKTPWHLWVVGVVSLLWNGYGAYDFVSTVTRGEAYFREMGMTHAQMDYFNAMPNWMNGPWVLGVWGAVIGSILLLLRLRWAVHAFAVSLFGAAVSTAYVYALGPDSTVLGATRHMNLLILAVAAFLALYAWRMTRRGVLR